MQKFEVVTSLAGRDKGKVYLVLDFVEDHVMLVDGKYKPIENPKKKKIKHVKSLNMIEKQLETIFYDKSVVNDAEIRKILKKYQKKA